MNKKILTVCILAVLAITAISIVPATIAPPSVKECNDGADNDGDGNIDWPADSGCKNKNDDDETDCGDGVCEGGETYETCPADCEPPTTTTTTLADSCGDTDGGNVPAVFGTTSGYYNGSPYSDDDYCVDAGNVMEYYCSGDYEQSSQESCGTDEYGSPYCAAGNEIWKDYTDYFCAAGECDSNSTPTFQEDCDDYDNYGSNYCLNGSVYRDHNDYYCVLGACDYSSAPELVEECQYGCTDGECDPPPTTTTTTTLPADSCSDTDGGYVFNVQGTVSGYNGGSPYNYTDYCTNITLTEYWCAGTIPYNAPVICNGTCVNGACTG